MHGSLRNGLFDGVVHDYDEIYYIEPTARYHVNSGTSSQSSPPSSSGAPMEGGISDGANTVVYRASDVVEEDM